MKAKYNKSVIMSRAWKLYKAQEIRTMEKFAECMRESWNIAKNGIKELTINRLYDKYSQQISIYISSRIAGNAVVGELVNDVFLKAEKHMANYDVHRANINTWLHSIAKNVIIDHYRKVNAVSRGNDAEMNVNDYTDDSGKQMFEVSTSEGADDLVNNEQKQKQIVMAFRALKPNYRKVATMFFLRELSHQEIAEALDVPVGTVKGMISRSRAMLKDALTNVHA